MAESSHSICVFCGSRPGKRPEYAKTAHRIGQLIAENGWRLVYGAGDVGLMGTVANAAQNHGGETFGVIPTHLLEWEVGKRDLTNFIITENMHERKKVMYMNSDAIVVLPGGAGSLDEFFEVLTWRQLGLHSKPIFFLNPENYWGPLGDLMNHVVDQGFADNSLKSFYEFHDDVSSLIEALRKSLA